MNILAFLCKQYISSFLFIGETWEPTPGAQRRSHALSHSGRPAEEAAVQPIAEGNQPRGGGRGPREGHKHGPAAGSAALQLKGEPRPASGANERYWGQSEAGSILWRLPSRESARVHAPSEGQIPGGCAERDGTANSSPRERGDRQAGETRVCQICLFLCKCFFSFVLLLIDFYFIPIKGRKQEVAPDLDLVADVIEHIDRHGDPGN